MFRLLQLAARSAAWILAAAWGVKAISVARGLRQVPNLAEPQYDRSPVGNPSLTVIVPARNEAANLHRCVTSLLHQTYPRLHIIAVDDRSTDATGPILDALATAHPDRLTALHITELPEGWLGKTHAMAFAARHALSLDWPDLPDWLLFTDGDVIFHPDAIRRALALAVSDRSDHFILLPTAIFRSRGEAMLLGCLQVLGFWAVRAWRVPYPSSRDAIGVGAFNLLRATAYERLGGFEALRLQIVEDLALGHRVKRLGFRQRAVFAPGFVSLHWAPGVRGVLGTMTKNLFAIFGYRLLVLGLACVGLLLLCAGPVVALLISGCRIPGLLALAAISSMYVAARPLTRVPARYALGFPVAAALLVFAIARSAAVTLRAGGVEWRGTFYPLPALRAHTESSFV